MSRVLGALYFSGGLLVLLSLLLNHPDGAFAPGLYGIVGVGIFVGTAASPRSAHRARRQGDVPTKVKCPMGVPR